ncbi:D-glutamate cyclase, mitochondrial isoform X1 [Carcharodon carcharias]|uniref:D-glutamate cyclase, mitochondrial isoform X1 n=1 Tax=Carcharodon carcharias TaxID=13397 RepID=UPI001B7E79E4|nr:D-glutamate cyclase, mitochondrial isoform X1 [Carcharodon carcharias]XP_041071192.1 D-glutamate cyclase, mitochondrial isoform X1 [Carcharodon carcharias]XP_041071193.1 D-glutamate cyclase, mitochondrial isoform X1 [Carcharodon carcharias]XP_041071194.1 D-glutamate cyclase, mitochondrial isoform X1 [Carcharodon carcharias]XP_041071195.1 D-glutamate cyclase, mitochondrial isoform X1 [Carcharodon carcharias]XP_041071197.1 D-glutamate cyclase, mitochondrial isoform X1 [Carcharodon carcharias]
MMLNARFLKSVLPASARNLIRTGLLRAVATSGLSEGFKQANIVIVGKELADDFEKFCLANNGPLPLLYRSKPGEWSSPPLSTASDIRTDCPQYIKYEGGNVTGNLSSLMECTKQLKDMVTFYLGCSFSFERALLEADVPIRNIEQGRNISMFRTSIPCVGVDGFQCNMVVTMRPIPVDKLDAVMKVTHHMEDAHGAPVHIGHPGLIGIEDLSNPDFGDAVEAHPGDTAVFWACGVTATEAIRSCKSPLAFTHAPGCMFITDLRSEQEVSSNYAADTETPCVFCISQNPLHYSVASVTTVKKFKALDTLIQQDPGNRGIKHLLLENQLLKACLSLSHARSVLITTGFPTHFNHQPPEETDGPPGAIAIAAMLQAQKKNVVIVTDQRALEMNKKIIEEAVEQGVLKTSVPVVSFQNDDEDSSLKFLCHDKNPQFPRFDHLVAIERAGMAADGNYYNAWKVNIKHLVDPIDKLFLAAQNILGIATTGIGDGGNELGMGKVKEDVKKYIHNGDLIACNVEADFTVIAGVSNWGGYAVACGLYILNNCTIHERYLRKAVGFPKTSEMDEYISALPTVHKEEKLLELLVKHGIRSGKTGNLGMEVDGLLFHDTHSSMIKQLLEITLGQVQSN